MELDWLAYASVATWSESSCVGEAVSGYILYICLGSELLAEAVTCCWGKLLGSSFR